MENIKGDFQNWISKRTRQERILRPSLIRRVPILVAICIVVLLFSAISVPSNGRYPSIADSRLLPKEASTGNNFQSNTIPADENIHVLWDMVHGNQAPSQFSNLITEIGSKGFVTDTLSSGPINASTLQAYNILVIAQPSLSYSTNETDTIHDFVLGGGGLLVSATKILSTWLD